MSKELVVYRLRSKCSKNLVNGGYGGAIGMILPFQQRRKQYEKSPLISISQWAFLASPAGFSHSPAGSLGAERPEKAPVERFQRGRAKPMGKGG